MTRKLLLVALASSMFVWSPVIPQPTEARTLFETLFPRAAERRKQRVIRQRQRLERRKAAERRARQRRLARTTRAPKVKKVIFKPYQPAGLAALKLVGLQAAFEKREHEIAAQQALEATTAQALDNNFAADADADSYVLAAYGTSAVSSDDQKTVSLESETPGTLSIEPTHSVGRPLDQPALRLSAGASHLNAIKLRARPDLAKALVAHYRSEPQFIWIEPDGTVNARGQDVLDALSEAEAYGLQASDYLVPSESGDPLRSAMHREFAITLAALRYMSDARHGIADPNKISIYHDFKGLKANHARNMARLAASQTPGDVMLAAHPKGPSFDALKRELAQLREGAANQPVPIRIRKGTFIKPGIQHDEVPNIVEAIKRKASTELLERHAEVLAQDHMIGEYSPQLVELVRDFQRENRLGADGIVGKRTIAKLVDEQPQNRIEKVLLAMERLRWHPDRLATTRVFINQPAYRAYYFRNGVQKVAMNTVVGKPSNQTNFFYDEIEYVEFNPYWGIPRSILVNEMLPKLRSNPAYFDNLGYEVSNGRRRIASASVDWWSVGADFPFDVRQPPGKKNALGELKIMFPNKHSIYMHDTPAKRLFSHDKRAYSHGCVRLADPRLMAAAVLGTSVDDIGSRIADGQNKQQTLASRVPVYVSYYTAWPDKAGNVQYFSDIYGRDNALSKALAKERQARAEASGA
ncbi:MAG: L,D-transpeptidase family protein [Ahrensia sp.]|nr:L,D-transpeptidase family protein [Ahrensia sp.]